MKLKSLLLGSAAVLALSTGAQAADPIVEFVSLGVCDTYGITGLTIESDDTCLSISGDVSYEYEITHIDGVGTVYDTGSGVEWGLAFEATTQTDAGAAVAFIGLTDSEIVGWTDRNDDDLLDPGEFGLIDGVGIDQAYVKFGDTTVLSAGLKDSIFDTEIASYGYGATDGFFDFDWDNESLVREVATGGHVIQIESLVADGFTVLAALEDLNGNGTAGLGVRYENGGISGEAGVLIGDIYDNVAGIDPVNFYARIEAEFDTIAVRGGIIGDDTGYWVAAAGATATFDMFTLDADAWVREDGGWGIASEAGFDATDTVAVYVGAAYGDNTVVEALTIYGGVNVDVTEAIALNAEVGYEDLDPGADATYAELGVTYAPGGGFETGLDLLADTDGDYRLTFNASKEF